MRILAAMTIALLPLTAASATPASSARHASAAATPAKCDRFAHMDRTLEHRQTLRMQRLGELPPGDLHLTVERQVNGCHQPVIVRQNIGGPAFGGR